jgi:hypothetical protein
MAIKRNIGEPIMRNTHKHLFFILLLFVLTSAHAQLACTYGAKGFQTVSYNGTTLMDVGANPHDAFATLHMVTEDLNGTVTTGDGDLAPTQAWNASTHTETYTYAWGTIAWVLGCSGSNLTIQTTVTDNAGSGVVFDGLETYLATFHFPNEPTGFYSYTQYAITTLNPGIFAADYGGGIATATWSDAAIPGYTGWKNVTSQNGDSSEAYALISTTTAPDSMASFFPYLNLKQQPGTTKTWTTSIRFTPEGTKADVSDIGANYRSVYPYQANKGQHKPIGTMYVANNPNGGNLDQNTYPNTNNPSGCGGGSGNPRNYKDYGGSTTCTDTNSLQDTMLHRGADIVSRSSQYGYWGTITWDIEGEEYPQDTSYVCSPDQIDTLAPEMDQTVTDSNYPTYANQTNPATGQPWRLVDAFFDMQIKSGLATGVCIRPNVFRYNASAQTNTNNPSATSPAGSAEQTFPINSTAGDTATAALLESKMDYAHNRWGATIFYIDSNVYINGQVLNPNIWQKVSGDRPNYILIPEAQHGQVETRNWAYTKQFLNLLDNNDLSSASVVTAGFDPRVIYPQTSSAVLINDMDPNALAPDIPALTTAVEAGDDLMAHADYDHPNNTTVENIYTTAASQAPPATTTTSSSSIPCPTNAGHVCWYVRLDGGTRYDATNAPNGQCDGAHDAAYPGTGTNQPCAFNSPVWFYERGDYSGYNHWVGSGGDTYFIRGALKDNVTYRIGWFQASAANDANGLYSGIPGDAAGSGVPTPPSGTSSAHTMFLGENYAACTAQPSRTQLHGGWGVYTVMTIASTQYIDVQCLDLTDFSSCGKQGQVHGCTQGIDDFSTDGLHLDNGTQHALVRNVRVHGLAAGGFSGPTGDDVLLDHVEAIGNASSGWNSDNGTDGFGVVNIQNFNISWNGCAEEYPIVHALPYSDCTDDSSGGYGDGFGTASKTVLTNGQVSQAYSFQPPNEESNGTWNLYSGTLPPGLTLSSSTGLISGNPTTAGVYPFVIQEVDSTNSSNHYELGYQIAIGNYPQGSQIHFTHGVSSYNTQDGLDALHQTGVGSTVSFDHVLAYGNMGQQIKIGGAGGILTNSYINGNCNALAEDLTHQTHIPGAPPSVYFTGDQTNGSNTLHNVTNVANLQVGFVVQGSPGFDAGTTITAINGTDVTLSGNAYNTRTAVPMWHGFNAKLGDFCRASDTAVPIGIQDGATAVYENNTLFSAGHVAVEIDCTNSNGAACGATANLKFDNNIFVGFTNSDNDYPSSLYFGSVNPLTNSGSTYRNNITYHAKNYDCTESGLNGVSGLCTSPLLKDMTFHPYDYGDPTPQTSSPAIASGVTLSNITTDFVDQPRPSPPDRGVIQSTSTFGTPVSITSNPVTAIINKIISGLKGLKGCKGCRF